MERYDKFIRMLLLYIVLLSCFFVPRSTWSADSDEQAPQSVKFGNRTYLMGIYYNYQKDPSMGAEEKQDRHFGYPYRITQSDFRPSLSLDPAHPVGGYNYNQYRASISAAIAEKLKLPFREKQTVWVWCSGAGTSIESKVLEVYYVGRIHGEIAVDSKSSTAEFSQLDRPSLEFKLATTGGCQGDYLLVSDKPFPKQEWQYEKITKQEEMKIEDLIDEKPKQIRKIKSGSGNYFLALKNRSESPELVILKGDGTKLTLVGRRASHLLLAFGDLDEDGLPEIGIPFSDSIGASIVAFPKR